jgi:hypothetical protein
MPRTARLTDTLRGRGNALVLLGAAAALAGAGTASAAALSPAAPQAPATQHASATEHRPGAQHAQAAPAVAQQDPASQHAAVRLTAAVRPDHDAAQARLSAVAAQPTKPYLIYDSVTPSAIPAHQVVAAYATGSYAASPSQVAGQKKVLWIDTNGSDPGATVLDVEPGDATPTQAASWASSRLTAHPHAEAIIYTMQSQWSAARAAIATLPASMQSHIRWWIADPTGVPHIVPGSDATQWYWGKSYDMTTATPRF